MKKIFLPIILVFVSILCLACGNNTDSNMSQIEGTTDNTSSKINIIIDENVSSDANDSNISQSEIEQIASEWENTEFEIEVNSTSSNNSSILSSDKSKFLNHTDKHSRRIFTAAEAYYVLLALNNGFFEIKEHI